jgi:hypothetical protein
MFEQKSIAACSEPLTTQAKVRANSEVRDAVINRRVTPKSERDALGREIVNYEFRQIGQKRKMRTKAELSADEIEQIVKAVQNDKFSHQQASIKFSIKPTLVSNIVNGCRKQAKFLEKAKNKEIKRKAALRAVWSEAKIMLD